MSINAARHMDAAAPDPAEAVLALHDAVQDYIQMLNQMREDAVFDDQPSLIPGINAEITRFTKILRSLDHWGLCPTLFGLKP